MHALVQIVSNAVAALATAAFAHFGVTVSPCHCPKSPPAVRSLTMSTPVLPAPRARRPLSPASRA